jgi:small subunit ribosomal protein S14
MAKKARSERNNRLKQTIDQYAERRATLKAAVMDKTKSVEERIAATAALAQLPRDSAAVRYRHRCELTGRPRGYYRRFGLCRNMLRELASRGELPGVCKSSW